MKNDYEIRGEITAIFLKRKDGSVLETLINTCDLPIAKQCVTNWGASWNKSTKSFYVIGNVIIGGRKVRTMLHRLIVDTPKGKEVDHADHDTLNNVRTNLRIASPALNQQNRRRAVNNTSGVTGVSWSKACNKWRAAIKVNGKSLHLGHYSKFEDAAEVANEARRKLMPYYTGKVC